MSTYIELDMVKIAEAEMETLRGLSVAERELLEDGHFRKFIRVGDRLRVYWGSVLMADLPLADLAPGVKWKGLDA